MDQRCKRRRIPPTASAAQATNRTWEPPKAARGGGATKDARAELPAGAAAAEDACRAVILVRLGVARRLVVVRRVFGGAAAYRHGG